MNLDWIIAFALLLGGLIANGSGFIVDIVELFNDFENSLNYVNTISCGIGILIIIGGWVILNPKKQYFVYSLLVLLFTAVVNFPLLLISSPDAVFLTYLPLIGPGIGLLAYKTKKVWFFGWIPLLVYLITFYIKIKYRINIFTDYIPTNIIHLFAGISSVYIFGFIVTTFSVSNVTELNKKLNVQLLKDPLTGILNREAFDEQIQDKDIQFGAMLDIDFFKKVNDVYGHKTGDTVLKSLCEILQEYSSETFKIYRYGGEEFFILSKMNESEFFATLKAIWIALNWRFKICDNDLTVSIGVAQTKDFDVKRMVDDADVQLYMAKENGRHQVFFENDVLFIN